MRSLFALLAALALALSLTPGASATLVDLNPEHHDRTVLVRVTDGVDPAAVHEAVGVGQVVNRLDEIGVDVVEVRSGTVSSAVAAYNAASDVVFAEPNPVAKPSSTPNDEFIDEWPYPVIDAFEGWAAYNDAVGTEFARSGGATIAVLDTGIDLTHAEFADKVTHCRSYLTATGSSVTGCQDNHFHGTHVTGTAAAITNNEIGIAGIGFDADVMSLQICNGEVGCFYADAAAALIYAANNGADVANMSFGGPAANQTLAQAVEYAANEGQMLLVAASGNAGAAVEFPARLPEVMAVGATDSTDTVASFSSRGPELDVAAPGVSILSTIPGPFVYLRASGTSMASPHVAGLGALLVNLGLSAEDARAAILDGAELVQGATGHTPEYGHGRINVANSIAIGLAPDDEDDKKNNGKKGSPPGRPADRPPT